MAKLPSLERLNDLRTQLHETLSHVQVNRMQCERLCERIDRLIDPLERLEHASSRLVRSETREILDQFLRCLDDCNDYIQQFQSIDQCSEEISPHDHVEEKFQELNQRLSQLGQDLSLGLNIQQLFDRQQDQMDRREDLRDLSSKLNDMSLRMSSKQYEDYSVIDGMFQKRLQSFRSHLVEQPSKDQQQLFLHIPCTDVHLEDEPLASGGFADVYKATWLTHQDQVAIKVLRLQHLSSIRQDFYREISTMYRIRYEHVLTILGACVGPNFYAIVMEYMPLGSLYDVLRGKRPEKIVFDWSDRYSLAWQMCKSIHYLHSLNPAILHRDIKSMNFLLKHNGTDQKKYLLKVCDFGLAEIRRETLLQSTSMPSLQDIVGSFAWKAPELFVPHGQHTKQSDVYSLGMVLWELATGRRPWYEYDDEAIILVHIKSGERPTIPSDVPEPYQQWIQEAWHADPQKRPSCFQLMERIHSEMNPPVQRRENKFTDLPRAQPVSEQYDSVISTSNTE